MRMSRSMSDRRAHLADLQGDGLPAGRRDGLAARSSDAVDQSALEFRTPLTATFALQLNTTDANVTYTRSGLRTPVTITIPNPRRPSPQSGRSQSRPGEGPSAPGEVYSSSTPTAASSVQHDHAQRTVFVLISQSGFSRRWKPPRPQPVGSITPRRAHHHQHRRRGILTPRLRRAPRSVPSASISRATSWSPSTLHDRLHPADNSVLKPT